MIQVYVTQVLGQTLIEVRESLEELSDTAWRTTCRMTAADDDWPKDTLGKLDWLVSYLRAMADELYAGMSNQEALDA